MGLNGVVLGRSGGLVVGVGVLSWYDGCMMVKYGLLLNIVFLFCSVIRVMLLSFLLVLSVYI